MVECDVVVYQFLVFGVEIVDFECEMFEVVFFVVFFWILVVGQFDFGVWGFGCGDEDQCEVFGIDFEVLGFDYVEFVVEEIE